MSNVIVVIGLVRSVKQSKDELARVSTSRAAIPRATVAWSRWRLREPYSVPELTIGPSVDVVHNE